MDNESAQTEDDPQALGRALREARKRAGLTQEQAARHIGIARTSLVALEQGKRPVKMHEYSQLARLYGLDSEASGTQVAIASALSPRKRVVQRVLQRTPDTCLSTTLVALRVPRNELERMAATILHLLIEQEQAEEVTHDVSPYHTHG